MFDAAWRSELSDHACLRLRMQEQRSRDAACQPRRLKSLPAAAWADLCRIYMELHIRFQVPRGEEEAAALGCAAERQDFPADRAALDAAGFPDLDLSLIHI
eukprot:11562660-Alexandrium_andersonii.AAC.1